MQRTIKKVNMAAVQQAPKQKRVAAYAEEAELLRMAAVMYLQGARPIEIERAFAKAGAVGTRGAALTGYHIVKLDLNPFLDAKSKSINPHTKKSHWF